METCGQKSGRVRKPAHSAGEWGGGKPAHGAGYLMRF